jgi:hypothetical protein
MADAVNNPWQQAEDGWRELVAASEKILAAAKAIQKTERSVDGYNIEKSLNKHKPDMMRLHLEGLRLHRKEHGV